MDALTFLLGAVIGFIAGVAVTLLLFVGRIKWQDSPRREVESFIAEFNRYYKGSQRESNSQ